MTARPFPYDSVLLNRQSCVVYPDLRSAAATIAVQAQQLITANLPAAGRQYCWTELLPSIIIKILETAIAQDDLGIDIRDLLEAAARHAARDWVPLHECERACEIVLGCVCKTLWDVAEPGHCRATLGLSRWAADRLPDAVSAVRAAYIDEMRRLGDRRRDDDVVIGALLNGGDGHAAACAVGRPLPEPCAVLALIPAGAQGPVQRLSCTAPPEGVLAALGAGPGALCAASWERSVLIAVVGIPPAPVGESVRTVRQLAEDAADACEGAYGRAFVAGLAMGDSAAAAGRAARDAVDVAVILARPDRRCRAAFAEEIALDMLVGSHDGLRRRLDERVTDVASRPDLLETLRALYHADLDRGRTARQLGIHRSTLDYRLGRVEQLAGISPTSVQGILLFAAASAATATATAAPGESLRAEAASRSPGHG